MGLRSRSMILLSLSIFLLLCGELKAADQGGTRTGTLAFRWESQCTGSSRDSLLSLLNCEVTDSFPSSSRYYVKLNSPAEYDSVLSAIERCPCVTWACLLTQIEWATDDAYYWQQWYLDHTFAWGPPYAQIHAAEAWAIETGDPGTMVAVYDRGVPWDIQSDSVDHLTHADLQNLTAGYPYLLRPIPSTQDMSDVTGHGTKVLSILAARTNNGGIGMAGVVHACTIPVYKGFIGDETDFRHVIEDLGTLDPEHTKVLNMSGGSSSDSEDVAWLEDVERANDLGILVVAAIGNIEHLRSLLPARLATSFDNVLAVGGSCIDDETTCAGNNFRADSNLSVVAPGMHLTVCFRDGGYSDWNQGPIGTSFAAPQAAGVSALVLSQASEGDVLLTPAEVKAIVILASDDCNFLSAPGHDNHLGYGRVNAFKALLRTPGNKELEDDLVIEPHHYDHDANGDDVSPYVLVDQLTVPVGLTLTIQPGARIKFAPGASINVYGTLIAEGTEQDSIKFVRAGTGAPWEIRVYAPADAEFSHCLLKQGGELLVSGLANVKVSDCRFDSMGIAVLASGCSRASLLVESNVITNSQYGIRGTTSAGTFRNNWISDCGIAGIRWTADRALGTSVESPLFDINTVTGCGNGLSYLSGGGVFVGTTARVTCNTFAYNNKIQISALFNANIVMDSGAVNTLINSTSELQCPDWGILRDPWRPLMQVSSSLPLLRNGNNTFHFDDDGTYVNFYCAQPCAMGLTMTSNYYEPDHMPSDVDDGHFCPFVMVRDSSPSQMPMGCVAPLEMQMSPEQDAFQNARGLEAQNPRAARDAYAEIMTEYPSSAEAIWSARGYLRSSLLSGQSALAPHDDLYQIWEADSLPRGLRAAARREAVTALIAGERFDDARGELGAIMADTSASGDSVWAALNDAIVDFLGEGAGGMRVGEHANNVSERLHTLDARVDAILGCPTTEAPQPVVEEPSRFTTSAHPNPFNSSVTIGLDLPASGNAKVDIFNVLGQHVTTLLDKHLDAGVTRLTWDAKGNAAGVYLYRVEFAGRVETHKLLLLK
jgi:hypothetical protein